MTGLGNDFVADAAADAAIGGFMAMGATKGTLAAVATPVIAAVGTAVVMAAPILLVAGLVCLLSAEDDKTSQPNP